MLEPSFESSPTERSMSTKLEPTNWAPCNSELCLLTVTAVGQYSRRFGPLLLDLTSVCAKYDWVRVALNIFDNSTLAAWRQSQQRCIHVSHMPVFKTLYWKTMLTPRLVRRHGFSHLFLVDSDLDLPSLDLRTLVRLQAATNVSLIAPERARARARDVVEVSILILDTANPAPVNPETTSSLELVPGHRALTPRPCRGCEA